MTLRIIHTGGEPECVPDPHTFVDTTVAVPRVKQIMGSGVEGHAGLSRDLGRYHGVSARPWVKPESTGAVSRYQARPSQPKPAFFRSERLDAFRKPKAKRYGPVTFLDRAKDQCAWIEAGGLCCGLLVTKGSWCKHHDEEGHKSNGSNVTNITERRG